MSIYRQEFCYIAFVNLNSLHSITFKTCNILHVRDFPSLQWVGFGEFRRHRFSQLWFLMLCTGKANLKTLQRCVFCLLSDPISNLLIPLMPVLHY